MLGCEPITNLERPIQIGREAGEPCGGWEIVATEFPNRYNQKVGRAIDGDPSLLPLHLVGASLKTPSVEPVLRSRLLPRVSFRLLFGLTTLAAIIAAVARAAGEGGALANAVMVSLGFIVACFLLFAILFFFSWLVSSLWYQGEPDALDGSPFASGQLPPQILPPREQRS